MKVAVASSGLGHVARGIETWALDTAVALHERGVDVTLFAAGNCRPQTTAAFAQHSAKTWATAARDYRPQTTDYRLRTTDDKPGVMCPRPSESTNQQIVELSGVSVSVPPCPPWSNKLHVVVLPSLRRSDALAKRLARMTPGLAWRWGFKSDYGWEQFSFWWKLWPRLKQGGYDILHVQDPMLAYWCRKLRRMGFLRTREILAHGTEESPKFLKKFDYVQHLAPWHLEQAVGPVNSEWKTVNGGSREILSATDSQKIWDAPTGSASPVIYSLFTIHYSLSSRRIWTAIPNFVDTERFMPSKGKEGSGKGQEAECGMRKGQEAGRDGGTTSVSSALGKEAQNDSGSPPCACRLPLTPLRDRLGIPPDAFVIGTVAAVKMQHKRIDYLIREFATFANSERQLPGADKSSNYRILESSPFLLVCGARTDESDELVRLAGELCPGRVKFLFDVSRENMPDVYRALDVFVLPSLFEMMPIALLEALASGLPVVVHEHPVLEWITGAGGKGQGERGKGSGVRRQGSDGRLQTTDYRPQTTDKNEASDASVTREVSESSNHRILESAGGKATTDHGKENTCASGGDYSLFTIHHSLSPPPAGAAIDMSREGELAGFLAGLTQSWMQESGRAARARAEAMFSKNAIIDRYRDYYNSVADDRRDAPMAHEDGNRRSSTTNVQHRTSNIEHRTLNQEPRTPNQEPRTKNQEPARVVAFTKDWDDVPTCTTHVLREMAKTMPVLWVSSIGTRRPSLGHAGDTDRAMKRLTRMFQGAERKETNLRVLSPLLVPKAQSAAALWLNRLLFAAQTWRELRRMGNGQLEYWCFVPNAVDLLPRDKGRGARDKGRGARDEGRGTRDQGQGGRTPNIEHRTSNIEHPTAENRPPAFASSTKLGATAGRQTTRLRPLDKARGYGGQADHGPYIGAHPNPRIAELSNHRIIESLVVYYCVDDWSRFENLDTAWISGKEREMLRRADVIFTPSRFLAEKCRGQPPSPPRQNQGLRRPGTTDYRPQTTDDSRLRPLDKARGYGGQGRQTTDSGDHSLPVHHVPHGVQYDMFAAALDEKTQIPADIACLPRPVIGFYGNIYPWIDFKLVESLAKAKPAWSFVMIGQVYCDVSPIAGLPNVFLLGRREHAILPNYCKAFAAAIIPYDMTHPRMQSVNPVKLLELLSAGVPVVSADLPDVGYQAKAENATADERRWTQMTEDVIMCSTTKDWLAALDRQVVRTDRREISRRAAGNDWSDRVRMMRGIVDSEKVFPTNHTNLHE